jgi:ArsR family transcriptional regulator
MIDQSLECCAPGVETAPFPVDTAEAEAQLALVAKALGHPMRVRIMRILLERRTCVCGEIVAELPLAQATVSQHLKILKEAGLVQGEIDGPRVSYCANADRIGRLAELIEWLTAATPIENELEVVLA